MKWYIIIILIGLVIALSSNQKTGQKESSLFNFRCSEDKSAIDMYNKATDSSTSWQVCTNGECVIDNGPHCIVTVTEAPAKQATPLTSYLPVLLAIGAIVYWKRRSKK